MVTENQTTEQFNELNSLQHQRSGIINKCRGNEPVKFKRMPTNRYSRNETPVISCESEVWTIAEGCWDILDQ